MLSYRHLFHAGNFADVFKHVILIQLVQALRRKEKPFCVIETHAGAGRYDLYSETARKNAESRNGIGRLWEQKDLVAELAHYVSLVQAFNRKNTLRIYPGSPHIVRGLLRHTDRLILNELHPSEQMLLEAEFANDRQVTVNAGDGYTALKTFLPPQARRGLVFIDPAFERKDEWDRLLDAVQFIHQRWATGMMAIWYPILDRAPSVRFQHRLQAAKIPAILCAELGLHPYDVPTGLCGNGMMLINPPWQFDETLRRVLPALLERLRLNNAGQTRVEWLVPAL